MKKSSKFMVWFIAIIMTLSIVGGALISSRGTEKKIELPENTLLNEPLSQEQISFLTSAGGVYIVFEQPFNCGESCIKLNAELQNLALKYKPFVYYYATTGTDVKIKVTTMNGEKELKVSGGLDSVEEEICSVLQRHPSCIEFESIREALAQ